MIPSGGGARRFLPTAAMALAAAVPAAAPCTFARQDGGRAAAAVAEGRVTDAVTGEPVPAVNVRLPGTARGTVSNSDGRYRLPLGGGATRIVFVHLAYESDTADAAAFTAGPDGVVRIDAALRPATLVYPEVVVLAEDPALEIIRKAIANKRRWMDSLRTYRFDAYTRQVVDRDTSVASITEAFTTGWVLSGDTLRERVVQKRQTANVPMEENFAAVRRLVNFNDDRITLFRVRMESERRAFTFAGPTAPDALELYDYRLLRTRRSGGIEHYEIAMTPRTRMQPLFTGTITIADRSFAVVGVDLEPNETFTLPFIRDLALRYRQQFALYDSLYWMPADIRIDGGFTASVMGFGIPRVGFRQVTSIYNYELNVPVPDSILAQRRTTVDSAGAAIDTALWRSNLVVPLTASEEEAYRSLDSTQTLERQFRPGGVLGALDDDAAGGAILGLLDARFTRVEGAFLGAAKEFALPAAGASAAAGAGYGFADRRVQYSVGASVRPFERVPLTFSAGYHRRVERTPDGGYYGSAVNSLAALLGKTDYHDYHRSRGLTAAAQYAPGRALRAAIRFTSLREEPMPVATDFSLSGIGRPFRPNPAAVAGLRRTIEASIRIGRERTALDLVTVRGLELEFELSSPDFPGGDFDYTRLSGSFTWHLPVFGGDFLFPASFRIRAFAGTSSGELPPQRSFSADTRLTAFAPFGVLRAGRVRELSGDAVVSIAAEQNFRSLPFLALDLPFLYRNGIELVAHGAAARSWTDGTPLPGGWHLEAGVGISRIFDVLRIDLTRRFREPRRWYVTFGAASFL